MGDENVLKQVKSIIIIFLLIIFSYVVSSNLINSVFHDYMFAIDMQNSEQYSITNSYENGIRFDLNKTNEYYTTTVPSNITGEELNLKILLDEENKIIKSVEYNGIDLNKSNIIKLGDISDLDKAYKDIPVFTINRENINKPLCISLLTTFIFSTLYLLFRKEIKFKINNNNFLSSLFLFSDESIKLIKKKDMIIIASVFITTFFVVVGCDARLIVNMTTLFNGGVDIYQLQVNTKIILLREFAEFPYNPMMLYIWSSISYIFTPIFKLIPVINNYPYLQVGVIKLVNLFFILTSVLSILSFMLKNKYIDMKKAKLVFYLAIFNPVTFYVSILFVQLDALTLYLFTLGILNLSKINENKYIGILFLSIGLLLKMQLIFLIPSTIVTILYIIIFNKDTIKNKLKRITISASIFFTTFILTFGTYYFLKTPFYFLEKNLSQSDRIWGVTIQYTTGLYLYLAIAAILIVILSFLLSLKSNMKKETIIIYSLIYSAVMIFAFSFAILPTPSIYTVSLAAFVCIMCLEKDILRNVIFSLMSVLIVFGAMFSDYGDITRLFFSWDVTPFLTSKVSNFSDALKVTYNSSVFTISAVAMLFYSIYMAKEAIKLNKSEENENDRKN